jgi:hypothetical protein
METEWRAGSLGKFRADSPLVVLLRGPCRPCGTPLTFIARSIVRRNVYMGVCGVSEQI